MTAHPILNPMPVLFAAFDLTAEDGGTHWCIRYALPIGESGPDHDSEVVCEVFDGFAYDYPEVDPGGADPWPITEAIAERMARAFNAHDAMVSACTDALALVQELRRGGPGTLREDTLIDRIEYALKLVKEPR